MDVYIRHRSRMVQESIFEDLKNTLIACRWVVGTTTHEVVNPAGGDFEVVVTGANDVYPLTEGKPIKLIDSLPNDSETPEDNTFAMTPPIVGEAMEWETGSSLREQPYLVSMAFYAKTDALAGAVFSDLKDRYEGRLVANEAIPLYDYLTDEDTAIAYLEIETFRFSRDPEMISPDGDQLYFAELEVIDYN